MALHHCNSDVLYCRIPNLLRLAIRLHCHTPPAHPSRSSGRLKSKGIMNKNALRRASTPIAGFHSLTYKVIKQCLFHVRPHCTQLIVRHRHSHTRPIILIRNTTWYSYCSEDALTNAPWVLAPLVPLRRHHLDIRPENITQVCSNAMSIHPITCR